MIRILLLSCCFFSGVADSNQAIELTGIKCIVTGRPAVQTYVAVYKQGKVFFDCNESRLSFESDKSKFAIKANHQLVVTGQYVQAQCPIKSVPISASSKVEEPVAGVAIRFCCGGCRQSLRSRGEKRDQIEFIFSDKKFNSIFVPRPKTVRTAGRKTER